jgi:hypothetical protein
MMGSTAHCASPLSGMVLMYVLMSAFHTAPWLGLISRRSRSGKHTKRHGLDVSLGVIARRRFARGVDGLWAAYAWLDRAPKERNETDFWWHRRDECDKGPTASERQ